MPHWSDAYMFRPYQIGAFDCADFTRLVQAEVFKRNVAIPSSSGLGLHSDSSLMKRTCDEIGVRTDTPADGDAVVMIGRGRLAHCGVYYSVSGVAWVIHNSREARHVVRHRIRELPGTGLTLDGFYKWI